mgnify:CR=1 FL=1
MSPEERSKKFEAWRCNAELVCAVRDEIRAAIQEAYETAAKVVEGVKDDSIIGGRCLLCRSLQIAVRELRELRA